MTLCGHSASAGWTQKGDEWCRYSSRLKSSRVLVLKWQKCIFVIGYLFFGWLSSIVLPHFFPHTLYFKSNISQNLCPSDTLAVFYYRTECMKAWSYSTAYVTTNGLQIHLLYFFWTRRISLKKKSRRALSLYAIQNMQVFYFLCQLIDF